MSELEGRVALITGASRGVGAAIAKALDARGAKVALASRSGGDAGISNALAAECDVRDPGQLESLVAAAVDRFGALDIVIANAGVGAYGEFMKSDPDFAHEIIDVNVKGLLHTVRAGLPALTESDRAELMVVASIAGQRAPEGEAVYSAAKHAQVGFMRSLDHELWRQGVRCSILCPGGIATDFAMGRGRTPDDPDLANFMSPAEVAEVAVYQLERPRSQRVLEVTLVPMAEDSMG
jgi:NADP-dependent 3-hydroxy acid dehydrogenase YdfG